MDITLRGLDIHCALLASFAAQLDLEGAPSGSVNRQSGESVDWSDVAAWLRIASSIIKVDLYTARFDWSVIMCSGAATYYEAESELLSKLVFELTRFNFIWGAMESIIKIIDPPRVPKHNSSIDDTCCYLRTNYEPQRELEHYDILVTELRLTLKKIPGYGITDDDFSLAKNRDFLGISGLGIHIVRKIRNKFAHGTLNIPIPHGNSDKEFADVEVIKLSSQICLITMQMLLITYVRDHGISTIQWTDDIEDTEEADASSEKESDEEEEEGDYEEGDVEETIDAASFLNTLHLRASRENQPSSKYQLPLPLW